MTACPQCSFWLVEENRQCKNRAACHSTCPTYCWQHAPLRKPECGEPEGGFAAQPAPEVPLTPRPTDKPGGLAEKLRVAPPAPSVRRRKARKKAVRWATQLERPRFFVAEPGEQSSSEEESEEEEESKEEKTNNGTRDTYAKKPRKATAAGYGFLSNFYPDTEDAKQGKGPQPAHSDFLFKDTEGKRWKSVEHYLLWHLYEPYDLELAAAIAKAPTATAAKQLTSQHAYATLKTATGLKPKKFYKQQIRRWKQEAEREYVPILRRALAFKFGDQNPQLRDALRSAPARKLAKEQSVLGGLLRERQGQLKQV